MTRLAAQTIMIVINLSVMAAPVFADCDNPATLFESKSCMYEEFKELSNHIKISYERALESISLMAEDDGNRKIARQKLVSAQKAWENFRDKDCEVYLALNSNESNAGQNELQCLIDRTRQRIEELDELKRRPA